MHDVEPGPQVKQAISAPQYGDWFLYGASAVCIAVAAYLSLWR